MASAVHRLCVAMLATGVPLAGCGDPRSPGDDLTAGAERSMTTTAVATTAIDQECLGELLLIDTALVSHQRAHGSPPAMLEDLVAEAYVDLSGVDLSRWRYSAHDDAYTLDGPCSVPERGPTTTLDG